jgi:3',5'-cyclic AMP phosphodiesterase CpdA
MSANGSRLVVHLSDLHFGREDPAIAAALLDEIGRLGPHLVAVSGDLTQRARRRQFSRARAFLDAIAAPTLVVPGNHDVPLYNLVARLFDPLGGYRRGITGNLQPMFADETLVAVGSDTTKPTTLKEGRIPDAEVARIAALLRQAPATAIKIFVGHHPFDAPEEARRDAVRGDVLATLTAAGVDVFLTGHLHVSYTGHTAHRYNVGGRAAIVVEAGTATSTRLRGEANAFNLLRIEPDAIVVERRSWQQTRFAATDTQRFERGGGGWASAERY